MTIEVNEEERKFLLLAVQTYLDVQDETITNRIVNSSNSISINQLHQKFNKIKNQAEVLTIKLNN